MKHHNEILTKFKDILDKNDIYSDEPMAKHSTFRVGGKADILVMPRTYEQIVQIINICTKYSVVYYVIGNGSNILVKDGGIRGVVIKLTNLNKVNFYEDKVTAQCGAMLKDVAEGCINKELAGMEFASGIPGCIGGAITMNAGAYDGEMSHIVESCLVIDENIEIRRLTLEELKFRYRKSAIQDNGYLALEVTMKLKKGTKDEISSRIDELTRKRKEKQPLDNFSAGSTFKRPEGHYTGKLVQDSGLKGFSIGGAQVSQKHSGFIINKGNATAQDILDLIKHVQEVVKENYGVKLEPEVKIIGEDK